MKACPYSTPLDKERYERTLDELKKKKKGKKIHIQKVRDTIDIVENESNVVEIQGSAEKPRTLGHMDQFSRPIDLTNKLWSCVKRVDIRIFMMLFLSRRLMKCTHTWLVYEFGISFNAINNDGFQRFHEVVG